MSHKNCNRPWSTHGKHLAFIFLLIAGLLLSGCETIPQIDIILPPNPHAAVSPSQIPSTTDAPVLLTPTPKSTPTPEPTQEPTSEPTSEPTLEPAPVLTPKPVPESTLKPTAEPTPVPTLKATPKPTQKPTDKPASTPIPTVKPTQKPTSSPTKEPEKVTMDFLADVEKRIVTLCNEERDKLGLHPLQTNEILNKTARYKSEEMATHNYFAHKSEVTGYQAWDIAKKVYGYKFGYFGENLWMAKDYSKITAEQIVQGWMDSEGHRKNILKADYKKIGVGVVFCSDTRAYATQVFSD